MKLRKKERKLYILLAILTLFLTPLQVMAEEDVDIPVPAETEVVKEEARRMMNSEMKLTYYASQQKASRIKDFYRATLGNLGWQEFEPLKQLEGLSGVKIEVESNITQAMGNNLVFQKDGLMFSVTFLPQEASPDKKTRFTVTHGKLQLPASGTASLESLKQPPALLTRPHKEVTPVYPGASLLNFSEAENSLRATYFTPDALEEVARFYKDKMPGYGWILKEEKPAERINTSSSGSLTDYCPSCSQTAIEMAKSVEMSLGELVFYNTQEDTCRIGLSYTQSNNAVLNGALNFTTIMVNYAQKKK